uniref:Uncharacterized protein n=1 Tax=Hyaloperonospora arabidopsidis (strain Emoy2) TaxID=559515 RepID=M4BU74_HYAAE
MGMVLQMSIRMAATTQRNLIPCIYWFSTIRHLAPPFNCAFLHKDMVSFTQNHSRITCFAPQKTHKFPLVMSYEL